MYFRTESRSEATNKCRGIVHWVAFPMTERLLAYIMYSYSCVQPKNIMILEGKVSCVCVCVSNELRKPVLGKVREKKLTPAVQSEILVYSFGDFL